MCFEAEILSDGTLVSEVPCMHWALHSSWVGGAELMYYYWVCGTQSLIGSTLFFWVIKYVVMVEGMGRNVVISERLLLSILGIHHTITLLWYVTYGMSLISDHDHVYMLCLMRIDSMWSIIWSASYGCQPMPVFLEEQGYVELKLTEYQGGLVIHAMWLSVPSKEHLCVTTCVTYLLPYDV